MRMDGGGGGEDISAAAQRRQAGRRPVRQPFPTDLALRLDAFPPDPNAPAALTAHSQAPPRTYEPKGFVAEVAKERRREARVSMPLFLEEVPYSRISLPPLVPVEVQGKEVAALVHTASHISLMSSALVQELGVRQDVLPDTSIPPSPLTAGSGSPWLVEGKLRYVELSFKGSKHITQLHVARDLPADLVLGVDFLKKAQIRVSFPDSAITLGSSSSSSSNSSSSRSQEVKVPFLTSREMTQHQRRSSSNGKARAYSSNY